MINLDFNIGDSVGEILKRTDVLVDGAYIDELRVVYHYHSGAVAIKE